MKELAVISGKGGTGKTSITASFAAMSGDVVLADCDVDAADLYLLADPQILHSNEFSGGRRAEILPDKCVACGRCLELCRFVAIRHDQGNLFRVDPVSCEGCGVCNHFCSFGAIKYGDVVNGECFMSQTRFGPMSHAKLGIAEENSGKLVIAVRDEARRTAEKCELDLVIIDGSPGIGCPVIASISGVDMVLAVTEPTLSGEHDLKRVLDLADHFSLPAMLCVNKWDINPEITGRMEAESLRRGVRLAGRISYDPVFTEAQVQKKTVPEMGDRQASYELKQCWKTVYYQMSVHD